MNHQQLIGGVIVGIVGTFVAQKVASAVEQRGRKRKVSVLFKKTLTNKRIKFCRSIQPKKVKSGDDEITFAESILGDNKCGHILFKRACYTDLFTKVEEARASTNFAGAVITGTPGIGKTMFGVFCLHNYTIEQNMTVLYKFRNEGYYVFSPQAEWHIDEEDGGGKECYVLEGVGRGPIFSGQVQANDEGSQEFVKHLKTRKDVIYVVDLGPQAFEESLPPAFTIILSSASREKYSHAVKYRTNPVKVLWMETWSKDEVQKHLGGRIHNLDDRYQRHGGVPRYLLWTEEYALEDLQSVLDQSSVEEFQVALDPNCKLEKFSGRLVHYSRVSKNRSRATATFASKEIRDRVAMRFFLRERRGFQATFEKMKFDTGFGSPRGVLSELVWHHQLRDGGDFRLKFLMPGTQGKQLEAKAVQVPEFEGEVVTCELDMRDLRELKEGNYVAPIGGSFPAMDAFVVTKKPFFDPTYEEKVLVGFQMASSKRTTAQHWLIGASAVKWIQKVKTLHEVNRVVVVFIVNDEDIATWSRQSFKTKGDRGNWNNYEAGHLPMELRDVEQFALGLGTEAHYVMQAS